MPQGLRPPTRAELLELDVDLRISSLWQNAENIEEWDIETIGAFMRAAYGLGYSDALREELPGTLFRDNGYRVPARLGRMLELERELL